MDGLTDLEKSGLIHLLETNEDPNLVIHLAKKLTDYTIAIPNTKEAYNIILLHSSDVHTVLSKKILTKEILFKYLHKNECPVRNDFTKAALITKVLEFWKTRDLIGTEEANRTAGNASQQTTGTAASSINNESEFPVNILARQFSEWFFNKYNQYSITIDDFWLDSQLDLRIVTGDDMIEDQGISRDSVLETLIGVRTQYGFYFNPTMSHEGVQGRLDIHGLALVLTCGTLHNAEQCVGVFEAVFSLARDPFAENNWKIKKIQLLLRNTNQSGRPPSLAESEAMKNVLSLPVSSNDI